MDKATFSEFFPQFADKYSAFDQLVTLVEEKSKVMNITAIRDYEGIWEKHIVDSLEVSKVPALKEILETPAVKILDVGTGAGFPGLALAVAYPNAVVTLCDATRKKLLAIDEFTLILKIKNVQTLWGRAEELSKNDDHVNSYDVVVARALAFLPELLELLAPFVKRGGFVVAYKLDAKDEIRAGDEVVEALRLRKVEEYRYRLPHGEDDRVILVYQKL